MKLPAQISQHITPVPNHLFTATMLATLDARAENL
ncbi:MAG: hypothetical protein RL481_807 [Pseudomonadota bacterium]|jgi:hypothetical protein